jgi:hypothetical protein
MMKLSEYSKEEKRAVFNHFFGDTNIRFGDLTPTQLEKIMNTFNGSKIVLRMRIKKFWQEVKDSAESRRK